MAEIRSAGCNEADVVSRAFGQLVPEVDTSWRWKLRIDLVGNEDLTTVTPQTTFLPLRKVKASA